MTPLVVWVAAVLIGGAAPSTLAGPQPQLSVYGRALRNFEALLHDTFDNRLVCTKGPHRLTS